SPRPDASSPCTPTRRWQHWPPARRSSTLSPGWKAARSTSAPRRPRASTCCPRHSAASDATIPTSRSKSRSPPPARSSNAFSDRNRGRTRPRPARRPGAGNIGRRRGGAQRSRRAGRRHDPHRRLDDPGRLPAALDTRLLPTRPSQRHGRSRDRLHRRDPRTPSQIGTEAGRVLALHADQALATLAAGEEELNALAGLEGGTIHIGASTTPGVYLLPSTLGCFRRDHPNVTVEVEIASTGEILERLL